MPRNPFPINVLWVVLARKSGALKSGKTAIEFKYVRPWEKDKAPAETKSVPVVIKEGN